MNQFDQFSRANIKVLTPYQSARRLGGKGHIWLNANEYPSSPTFVLDAAVYNRYPEPQPQKLLNQYANYAGLEAENLLISRGADEGIELIIRAFCELNELVLYCPPTYGMYEVSAKTCGIETLKIPLKAGFELDLTAIETAINTQKVKVIFLCSPNNPTGNLIKRSDIFQVLAMAKDKCLVVLDEAYIEFTPEATFASELENYPHLIILRTLSKAFALAGLRVGFTMAHPKIISILQKVIAPYPIPSIVASIAEQALSDQGIENMRARALFVNSQKLALTQQLSTLSYVEKVYESAGNYLLVKFKDSNAIFDSLWEQGVILRHQTSQMQLENCIRITIGSEAENTALIEALRALDN